MKSISEQILANRLSVWDERILTAPFESLSYERLRKRIILEQYHTCIKCKNNTWLDESIALELDQRNTSKDNIKIVLNSITGDGFHKIKYTNRYVEKYTDRMLFYYNPNKKGKGHKKYGT